MKGSSLKGLSLWQIIFALFKVILMYRAHVVALIYTDIHAIRGKTLHNSMIKILDRASLLLQIWIMNECSSNLKEKEYKQWCLKHLKQGLGKRRLDWGMFTTFKDFSKKIVIYIYIFCVGSSKLESQPLSLHVEQIYQLESLNYWTSQSVFPIRAFEVHGDLGCGRLFEVQTRYPTKQRAWFGQA